MGTIMSEKPCILVLSGDDRAARSTVENLRRAGWEAVGTSDPWEAILLVSRRSFSLIVQDRRVSNSADVDLEHLLDEDPVLKEVPRILASGPEELLGAVQDTLVPRFPMGEPSEREQTRFIRRRRPVPALQ